MAATESQRQVYRDKFRSLHNEAFQSWFEQILSVLHPPGDFQAVRKTSGDGGLDAFVISAQLVYQVYAPATISELRDSKMATKIRADFGKALATLGSALQAWTFLHNHPEGKIGKRTTAAVSRVKTEHPRVEVSVLNIDSLWERLSKLPSAALAKMFGLPGTDNLHAKLLQAEDCLNEYQSERATELFKEVLFASDAESQTDDHITALLGLFAQALNGRDEGAAKEYLRQAEKLLDKTKDSGLRVHVLRAKANLLDHRREDAGAEAVYLKALAVAGNEGDEYIRKAILATTVDLTLFYCRTKRLQLAKPLIEVCQSFLAETLGGKDEILFVHALDAIISYALCAGDREATSRSIQACEDKATTKSLARQFAHLLQKLGLRAAHLKAYDLGILCCESSIRLSHRAGDDGDAVAAEHTAAMLLYEKGDLVAARNAAEVLLGHVRAAGDHVLLAGTASLVSAIAHKLGDYGLAISVGEEGMRAAGGDFKTSAVFRHGLAESLCGAGRIAEGLAHARSAYTLARGTDLPEDFVADILFVIADAACLLGDWHATDEALTELGKLSELSDKLAGRRKHLIERIEGCRFLRGRLDALGSEPNPLQTAGTIEANSIGDANARVLRPLLEWWEEAPGLNVPPGYERFAEAQYPKNLAVLYDYWGRGNMARFILNLRGFDHTLNLTLEVRSLTEVKRAVRLFTLFTDVLILLWKGPVWSSRVIPVVPAFNQTEGGAGYVIFPAKDWRRKTERSGDWFPAVGYGSFLPDDVMKFLAEEALTLLGLGRLLIVPASGVGCIHEGHGPFESIFAELCRATPMLRSDATSNEFPIGWVPYFPEAPISAFGEVISQDPEALRRLRLVLARRTREIRGSGESAAASKELEIEIVEALAQLKDLQLSIKRKSGWDIDTEALGNSAVRFSREDLLGATWKNATGSYLHSYGNPQSTLSAAEWLPVLTLQTLGHRWSVVPTTLNDTDERRKRGPDPGEAVGAWLAPRGHDVRVAMIRKKDNPAATNTAPT